MDDASSEQYVSPSDLALICMALGDNNEAFSWLEKAYEQRDASLV
jgi:hypothetical protein